jgi:hypothetical protein
MNRPTSGRGLWRRVALALALAALWSGAASAQARFATECQSDYQNGWLPTLPEVWNRCGWFNSALGDLDILVYYYNLAGAKPWWEDALDQGGMETVNLLYANTHGGAWTGRSVWAMWDQNTLADSAAMRLGDESWGLSIFATYSCETLKIDGMWTRMAPIFKGGLRFAAGSHDTLFDSSTTNEAGEDFADNLQHRWTIAGAWSDAVSDWWEAQDAAVMATGQNSLAECESRRDGMTWQNYPNYPILRDGQASWYCYRYWTDL